MRLFVLTVCLITAAACQRASEVKQLTRTIARAQQELSKTLGVPVSVHVRAGDLESPREVTLTISRTPAGLTPEQVERNANIIMRKAIPKIEVVEVRFSQ